MVFHATFGSVLVAVAAILLWMHLRYWHAARRKVDESERRFAWAQFRRRMQTSAMIGLVGVLIFGGYWVERPLVLLGYWLFVLLLLVWIILLAGADILATRVYYSQRARTISIEENRLRAMLRAKSNGHPASPPGSPGSPGSPGNGEFDNESAGT